MPAALRDDLERAAEEVAEEWGFSSVEEFVNEAVENRILEFRRCRFFEGTDRIREGLEKKGFTERELLRDFETRSSGA
ncbi:MAG: hypothetical protein MAG715_00116 [Methanonatronarchaeales archaeon]|nr:hypothetical protein [Methanonatronarchaeales archaeon]